MDRGVAESGTERQVEKIKKQNRFISKKKKGEERDNRGALSFFLQFRKLVGGQGACQKTTRHWEGPVRTDKAVPWPTEAERQRLKRRRGQSSGQKIWGE